jgi:hypothetical protein
LIRVVEALLNLLLLLLLLLLPPPPPPPLLLLLLLTCMLKVMSSNLGQDTVFLKLVRGFPHSL